VDVSREALRLAQTPRRVADTGGVMAGIVTEDEGWWFAGCADCLWESRYGDRNRGKVEALLLAHVADFHGGAA
jgi:hypothetical protein